MTELTAYSEYSQVQRDENAYDKFKEHQAWQAISTDGAPDLQGEKFRIPAVSVEGVPQIMSMSEPRNSCLLQNPAPKKSEIAEYSAI